MPNFLKEGRLQALTRQQLQAQATQIRQRRWVPHAFSAAVVVSSSWDWFAPVDLVRSVATAWQNCSAAPACEPRPAHGGSPGALPPRYTSTHPGPLASLPLSRPTPLAPTRAGTPAVKSRLRALPWARFGSPVAHLSLHVYMF